jgi:Fibronectin type III domain
MSFANFMTPSSIRLKLLALLVSFLVCACGGGSGGPASPPASGIIVVPGNGQVTVSWTPDPDVQYWLWYAPGSTVTTTTPGHLTRVNVSSPYVLTGLTNGATYTFAINGRTGNGAGGPLSATMTSIPRPAGATWTAGTSMGGAEIRAVTFGTASDLSLNYLAVGASGSVFKAVDGINWTPASTAPAVNFNATLFTLSQFIAVSSTGGTNNIYRTADFVTWTAPLTNPGAAQNLNALASNGTLVVAVGDNGTIQSSGDGITWTTAASVPTTNHLYGVAYAASGLWVAVGANGVLLTSVDGTSWTARASGTTNTLRSVAASTYLTGYQYVAVGLGGVVSRSLDGTSFVVQTLGTADLYGVNADPLQILAVGFAGAAYTSPDAITWTSQATGTTNKLAGVFGSPTQYIAVGAAGTNISSR